MHVYKKKLSCGIYILCVCECFVFSFQACSFDTSTVLLGWAVWVQNQKLQNKLNYSILNAHFHPHFIQFLLLLRNGRERKKTHFFFLKIWSRFGMAAKQLYFSDLRCYMRSSTDFLKMTCMCTYVGHVGVVQMTRPTSLHGLLNRAPTTYRWGLSPSPVMSCLCVFFLKIAFCP